MCPRHRWAHARAHTHTHTHYRQARDLPAVGRVRGGCSTGCLGPHGVASPEGSCPGPVPAGTGAVGDARSPRAGAEASAENIGSPCVALFRAAPKRRGPGGRHGRTGDRREGAQQTRRTCGRTRHRRRGPPAQSQREPASYHMALGWAPGPPMPSLPVPAPPCHRPGPPWHGDSPS